MTVYRMEDDGVIVDTDRATAQWDEATRWNGNNHISVATGSQWNHEKLYRSSKGRFYIESASQWQGSTPSAFWVSPAEAAAWLLCNDHEVPPELADAAAEVVE